MWTAPQVWYLDENGDPTTNAADGVETLISTMPLSEAVRLGIAAKDGTPIDPKVPRGNPKKAIKAKAKEE